MNISSFTSTLTINRYEVTASVSLSLKLGGGVGGVGGGGGGGDTATLRHMINLSLRKSLGEQCSSLSMSSLLSTSSTLSSS